MNRVIDEETIEKKTGRLKTFLVFSALVVGVLLLSWLLSGRGEDTDRSRGGEDWESSVYWIGDLEECVQCRGKGRVTREARQAKPQMCPSCEGKKRVPEGTNLRYMWLSGRISEKEFRRRMRVLTDGEDYRQ